MKGIYLSDVERAMKMIGHPMPVVHCKGILRCIRALNKAKTIGPVPWSDTADYFRGYMAELGISINDTQIVVDYCLD